MPAADLGPLKPASKATLARKLDLPLAVLFGLGVTIGAGIYVLIGATAARAGMHAPLAFLLAALVMAPTAASFAELAGRMPVSAGEAAYVRAGFGSESLSLVVGCMVIATGVISAAAISRGSAATLPSLSICRSQPLCRHDVYVPVPIDVPLGLIEYLVNDVARFDSRADLSAPSPSQDWRRGATRGECVGERVELSVPVVVADQDIEAPGGRWQRCEWANDPLPWLLPKRTPSAGEERSMRSSDEPASIAPSATLLIPDEVGMMTAGPNVPSPTPGKIWTFTASKDPMTKSRAWSRPRLQLKSRSRARSVARSRRDSSCDPRSTGTRRGQDCRSPRQGRRGRRR